MNTLRILSVVEIKALLYLYNHSQKINMTMLSRRIDVVYVGLSNKIITLEKKGLVQRIKMNKMSYDISLTPNGRKVTELILKVKGLVG